MGLKTCSVLLNVNLSRNQPGRQPSDLIQLVREHKSLTSLSLVEDDEKHLTSKAKTLIGEAMSANPNRKLAHFACNSFNVGAGIKALKWVSTLPADVTLLAGVLRSNTTLTALNLEGTPMGDAERTELGKALLGKALLGENELLGGVGLCDEFELGPHTTELEWDLKDAVKARKGAHLLFGILAANRKLVKLTLRGVSVEMIPLLAQSMRSNPTLKTLQLDHQYQTLKNVRNSSVTLSVQDITGRNAVEAIDLSAAGELSKPTCMALGALMASNKHVKSLQLSNTKLGDESGSLLENLGNLCKTGTLTSLDLSGVSLTDKGGRKLFDAMLTGEFMAIASLSIARNDLRDPKINGLLEVLRMPDCSLTSLDMSETSMGGAAVMRALKFNTSLNYLNVRGCPMDGDGVGGFGDMLLQSECSCPLKLLSCDDFAVLEHTREIDFSSKHLKGDVLTLLFGILKLNESVTALDLSGVGMDVEAAKALEIALRTNATLQTLTLRDNAKLWPVNAAGELVDAEGLKAVARGLCDNHTVCNVNVDSMTLDVRLLKGVGSVDTLDLSSRKDLTLVSASLISLLVEANSELTKLDVSGNTFIGLGRAIGTCLQGNTTLAELTLRQADLRDVGVAALADGLQLNAASRLARLDLYANSIGASGAECLAALLASNLSLKVLDLGKNELGSWGVTLLAAKLADNKTLSALSLHENAILEEGAASLGEALRSNATLTTLWLGKNQLKNEGVQAFVGGILAAPESKLKNLDVQANGITSVGLKAIGSLLSSLGSLHALSVAGESKAYTNHSDASYCHSVAYAVIWFCAIGLPPHTHTHTSVSRRAHHHLLAPTRH